jgi:hypothetical protein
MLKKILLAFAIVVGLLLAIGLALPSKYRVERSTTIQAPSEAVYAYVANLRRWQEWAPWNAEKYPGNQWMFGGPEVGVGAVHSWSGADVGNGTLSLTQADPKTGVAYDMSVEHGRYLLHGRISFSPEGQGTRVTWVDEGNIGGNPLAHYLVPLIRSRLGGDIEEGLAQLKKRVESNPLPAGTKPEPAPAEVGQGTAPAQPPELEKPAPSPAEDTRPVARPAEGTQGAPSPAEGSQVPAPSETAPTTPPTGEPASASPGNAAPPGGSAPVETPPAAPAPVPAPAAGETASPT